MTKRQLCVQVDEEIAQRMEEIREKTGIPISRQIELRLKGFKIVEDKERAFGQLFDNDESLNEVQKRWSEAFGNKTTMDILHRKKE